MSIASELVTLANNKAAIKAAIIAKNPTVAPTDALSQWPTSIASISGSIPLPYDEEVDYLTIPAGAYFDLPLQIDNIANFISLDVRLPSNMNADTNFFLCGNWAGNVYSSTQLFSNSSGNVGGFCYSSSITPSSSSGVIEKFGKIIINGPLIFIGSSYDHSSNSSFSDGTKTNFCIGGCKLSNGTVQAGTLNSFDLKSFNSCNRNVQTNCIPVRVGQAGALYDTISGTLYENVGSGTITPVKLTA